MSDEPSSRPPREAQEREESALLRIVRTWVRAARRPRNGEELRDTIEELISEHEDEELSFDPGERALLKNILNLHELAVDDVKVPRADIVAVEEDTRLAQLIKVMTEAAHSRLPVFRETLDDVIGMVHIKDVLAYDGPRRTFKLAKLLREVLFAAPSMRVLDLLAQMRDTRVHLALVVDEFGGIDGLVSIEDLVEAIVGDIEDEHDVDDQPTVVEDRKGSVVADARVTIEDFEKRFGALLSEEEREEIETLGGLVFSLAGRVPARGELIKHPSGIEFEIVEADPRRIRQLRVRGLPQAPQADV